MNYRDTPYVVKNYASKWTASKKYFYTLEKILYLNSENEAKKKKPDFYLVLPWHFKDHIIKREKKFLKNGGKLIFPLPDIEII